MPRKSRIDKFSNEQHRDEHWQQAWNEPEAIDAVKKQALLNSIHRHIDTYRRKKRQLFFIGIGAAAAILITIFINIPGNDTQTDISSWRELTSSNATKKVVLDDGSVIWLAPHSVIRVYPDFLKQRSTMLTHGTAFFSVAKDAKHPFSIAVNRQQVTVVGTAFSIHKLDSVDIHLTVQEGKVALDNASGRQLVTVGQQVSTTQATTGAIHSSHPGNADWWLQQQVRWENISLEDLLDRVEMYYQVKLSYGAINKKMKVTLTWDLTISLEDNLAVLNSLTGYNIH